jgi:DNA modification methylase
MASVRKLKPNKRNVRTHSKKQIKQLANSILRFGWTCPIIVDENFTILAGHARLEAAKVLGLREVPVIIVSGLSDAEKRAWALADNKIASNAGWDRAALAVGDLVDPEQDPLDEIPEIPQVPVSRLADLWRLEKHLLLCGDARVAANFASLMRRRRASMVFTDPPYNVRIASVQGRGQIRHREFAAASGELSPAQFRKFLTDALSLAARYSVSGSIHYVCMDWRHIDELSAAGKEVYSELKNLVVWAKSNAGQGTFYRSQHELVFVFKSGDDSHLNNFELGQHGRSRSNVWQYAGVNSFRAGRLDELALHPTVKPVALVADAMRDCSRRGDIVLDPFMGSGTTILAAERVGRVAYGLEIDPLYVDTAVRRWEAYTKCDAILEKTGQTFAEVSAERSRPKPTRRRS